MKERLSERADFTLDGIRRTDVSEIFLFFDYDFHHSQLSVEEINKRVEEMLQMFDNETDNGKLYINYPMIESIRYTKELPDENYYQYEVYRDDCRDFKKLTHDFSFYNSFDHILFRREEKDITKERYQTIEDNWKILIQMKVCKAYWLISDSHVMPSSKSDIDQLSIFLNQKFKYVERKNSVSVLNAFPIFIYEYMK